MPNQLTVFESTPFSTHTLSSSARIELEGLLSQAVYVHGVNETADHEDKYIFTPLRDQKLVSWNYVGVVQTSDGTVIEILPKIFRELGLSKAPQGQQAKARILLLRMLLQAGLISYRKFDSSLIDLGDFSLLEVFIHSFLSETQKLTRKGLKKDYVGVEKNLTTLKGRIHFPTQIKRNASAHHRFFCRYDEYSTDCIENRLLLTALRKVHRISKDNQNKKIATQILSVMDNISLIHSPEQRHFAQCRKDRHMRHYEEAIKAARYVLLSPPVPQKGNENTTAILFNMAALFEKTIEKSLGKSACVTNLVAQKALPWFKNLGSPRPDYVFAEAGQNIVADAKWKLPKDGKPNHADQYQLFSYMKILQTETAYILYPKLESFGLQYPKNYEFNHGGICLSLHLIPFSLDTFTLYR